MSRADETRFRRWLIDRIKETCFQKYSGESIEELAQRLGVQADVLRTAQAERAEELTAIGRPPIKVGSARARGSAPQLTLHCPKNIFQEMHVRATRLGVSHGELVRAIANTLLSGPDNPIWLYHCWMFEGVRQVIGYKPAQKWYLDVALSKGAHVALDQRATRLGTNKTALLRGAITDYLEGRMTGVCFVPVSMMWQDPKRYWTGELIRKGEYHGHSGTIEPRVANQH
jgi:hypothetical protein